MNRAATKRVDSPTEQENDQRMAEEELDRLHRQYRIVEGNRKAYFEEARNIIRKQMSHIGSMNDERDEIDRDLKLALGQANTHKDQSSTSRLKELMSAYEDLQVVVADEEGAIVTLDEEMKQLERNLQNKYKGMGGSRVDSVRHVNTQKRIRVLENRLDKATVSFNSMLTNNNGLRERIEHLRRERAIYDKLYRKLSKEQSELKSRITEMIDEATAAYDTRDEAQTKMGSLRERTEREQTLYNVEIKELRRIIDHDQKLKDFMAVKSQERAEWKAVEAAKRKKKEDKKANERARKEEIELFEGAFGRVRAATGQEDLDALVHDFVQKEDVNFAVYNYVNELNNEAELLQDGINALNADIGAFQKQGMTLDRSRQNILKDLEAKHATATRKSTLYERQLKHANKLVDQLKSAVERTFRRLGCDDGAITDMLGSSSYVTVRNVMLFLSQIEQTTSDLMLIQHFQRLKTESNVGKGDTTQPPLKQTGSVIAAKLRPASRASINIIPPSLESQEGALDDDEPIDDVQPLSADDLRQRVIRTIRKKDAQPRKVKGPNEGQPSPSKGTKTAT